MIGQLIGYFLLLRFLTFWYFLSYRIKITTPNQLERMGSMSVMHISSNKRGWSPKLYSRAVWQAEYTLTHKKLEVSLDVNSATVTYRSCDYMSCLPFYVTLQWKPTVWGG